MDLTGVDSIKQLNESRLNSYSNKNEFIFKIQLAYVCCFEFNELGFLGAR
jgi:hypothetical protein